MSGTGAAARRADHPGAPGAVEAAAARVLAFGRRGLAERPECSNIASPIGLAQYLAIAAEVAAWIGRGRALDWGAGWGQTSLLLRAHGVRVVAYDVEDKGAAAGLLGAAEVPYVVTPGPALPFVDGAFDAVLNCGVLEHVADERAALAELRRVLRPGGRLFTYHLPNRHAYTEWAGRRLGGFHHERTYTRPEAYALFEAAGFRVTTCRAFHVLPRNVWGRLSERLPMAPWVSAAYDRLDAALARIPGVRRVATAWAIAADRPPPEPLGRRAPPGEGPAG
ncbi:MAG TPA: methyltransferase domain-containing protein [Methylomirabilota bacterium]|jgi:ubiquinone/menaquinone biosynthesis C-methylase UbiE